MDAPPHPGKEFTPMKNSVGSGRRHMNRIRAHPNWSQIFLYSSRKKEHVFLIWPVGWGG